MRARTPPVERRPLSGPQVVLVVAAYLLLWMLLDYVANVFRIAPPNISVWYPPAALSITLVLVFGPRFAPLLAINGVLEFFVMREPGLSLWTYVIFGASAFVVYGGAAVLLLRTIRMDPRLPGLRDVLWFVLVAALAAPLLLGAVQAANAAWQGVFSWSAAPFHALMYWAGDATGIASLAPVLLLLTRRVPGLWAAPLERPVPFILPFQGRAERLEGLGEAVAAALAAFLAFGIAGRPTLDHTYVLFLPVLWAAVRYGFGHVAVVVLLTNVSVMVVVGSSATQLNGIALQFGLMTVTLTGVLLGAVLSDRRRQIHELTEARKQAEEATRLKASLLMNMSHETRTPLTGILGYAGVITEEATGDVRRHAQQIIESGQRLYQTLTSVLHLSYLESSPEPVQRTVDVGQVTEGVAQELRPLARRKGLTLHVAAPVEEVSATLDPEGLRGILTNLIGNAIKFTREGRVDVEIGADGDTVLIRVRDTGAGISEVFLPHVFEPFRQESEGLGRTHEGSGLGLSITARLVHLLGGSILVESTLGQGSTFTVRLPRDVSSGE